MKKSSKAPPSGKKRAPTFNAMSHLERDQSSFAEQMPAPEVHKPDAEFALLNVLAKLMEALNKMDPNKPEVIVLQGMAKNFIVPETMADLANGGPVKPKNSEELQTPAFKQAYRTCQEKYKRMPPQRDSMICVRVASAGRPLTTNEIFNVFKYLSESIDLTPEQWQFLVQQLVLAVKLMKQEAEEMNGRMQQQQNPNMFELAQVVADGTAVNADGTLASRAGRGGQPPVQKPDEAVALLELTRDFWMAMFKAGEEAKLRDDHQRELADLLRSVGLRYVRTGRSAASMQTATPFDAKNHRFLIRKLRADPRIKADRVKMAALDKLAMADQTGKPLTSQELVEILDALGRGIEMTPDMLRAILEYMITHMRTLQQRPDENAMEQMIAGRDTINPIEAMQVVNKATIQKPQETMALLDLYTNFFLAMHATKQNAVLRDQVQRMMAETLRNAGQLHSKPQASRMIAAGGGTSQYVDINAHRILLMKLRAEPQVKADWAKARAVEELVEAQATGKPPTPQQLLDIFRDLGHGMELTQEMAFKILEFMCTQMRTLTPGEKAKLQNRMNECPPREPADFVREANQVKTEENAVKDQARLVGCVQVFPEGHRFRPLPPTTQSREMGMRAGPASVEWHRYQPLGIHPPATEMARILMVQTTLTDVEKFDEKTQKTLMHEAADVTYRSIMKPSVMAKWEESLKTDKEALSALVSLKDVGTMDDKQLGKRVDKLLTTLFIDRGQLRGVLDQLVRDRLMTHDESKEVENRCEMNMAAGGGRMKLSELQDVLRAKKK